MGVKRLMNHMNCGCETKNTLNFVDPSNDRVIVDGRMLFKHLFCGNAPVQLWESLTAESTKFVTLCLKSLSTFWDYCKQIVLVLDGNTDLIGLKDDEHLEGKKRRHEAVLKAYTIVYFKFHKTGKSLMKQLMAQLKDKTSPSCTNLSQQECTQYKEGLQSQNLIKSDGRRCFTPVNSFIHKWLNSDPIKALQLIMLVLPASLDLLNCCLASSLNREFSKAIKCSCKWNVDLLKRVAEEARKLGYRGVQSVFEADAQVVWVQRLIQKRLDDNPEKGSKAFIVAIDSDLIILGATVNLIL